MLQSPLFRQLLGLQDSLQELEQVITSLICMLLSQSSRKRRITRIGTHVFSLGRMFSARQEFRVRMFFSRHVADR